MHLPTAGMKCSSIQEHAALLELQGQLRSKHQQRNENIPCNSRKILDLHDDVPGSEKYSREAAARLDGGQRLLAVALLHADVHIVLPRVVGLSGVREGICGSTGDSVAELTVAGASSSRVEASISRHRSELTGPSSGRPSRRAQWRHKATQRPAVGIGHDERTDKALCG